MAGLCRSWHSTAAVCCPMGELARYRELALLLPQGRGSEDRDMLRPLARGDVLESQELQCLSKKLVYQNNSHLPGWKTHPRSCLVGRSAGRCQQPAAPTGTVHHATGTVLASSSLEIRGARGVCLEVALTQTALHSPGIPLWGYEVAHPLTGPGDLGCEQPTWHSSANRTGVQDSVLQRPVPTTVPVCQGWGFVLGPPRHAAPASAVPQLPTGPGPYVPAMLLRCCCQA